MNGSYVRMNCILKIESVSPMAHVDCSSSNCELPVGEDRISHSLLHLKRRRIFKREKLGLPD